MTKIEEIYAEVLPLLAAEGIEDTPDNRLAALIGLQAAWREDTDDSVEKVLYMMALGSEIFILKATVLMDGIQL